MASCYGKPPQKRSGQSSSQADACPSPCSTYRRRVCSTQKRGLLFRTVQERRRLRPITVRASGSGGDVLQLEFVEERHEAFDVGRGAGLSLLEELPVGEDLDDERDVA